MKLVVIAQFPGHEVGQEITDPAEVADVLDGPSAASVVKVATPEAAADPNAADRID